MKRRFLPIALLLAGSLAAADAYAQENTLRVEKKLIERSGDYLLVDLTLNLSDLEIRSNRSVTYTPVIQRGDSLRRLPALIVNGRKRQIPIRAHGARHRHRRGVRRAPQERYRATLRLSRPRALRPLDGRFRDGLGDRRVRLRMGGSQE